MSHNFCECGSTLNVNIINDKIIRKCNKCKKEYESTEEYSVLYEVTKVSTDTSLDKYESMINYAIYDSTIPIINESCPECGHFIAKQLRLGEDEIIYKICISCRQLFL